MGYTDNEINTIGTNLISLSESIQQAINRCCLWKDITNQSEITTTQASGLSTNLDCCMGSVFSVYELCSGVYNGI